MLFALESRRKLVCSTLEASKNARFEKQSMTVTKKTDRRRHSTPAAITDRANDTKKQTARWLILTLLLLAILPYLQTFRHNFVNYDDGGYVWQNPRVHEGLTWSNIHGLHRTVTERFVDHLHQESSGSGECDSKIGFGSCRVPGC